MKGKEKYIAKKNRPAYGSQFPKRWDTMPSIPQMGELEMGLSKKLLVL